MSEGAGTHAGLHSEQGALRGEHPGRATNPVIKVHDIAWLEFEKPDLVARRGVRRGIRLLDRCSAPQTNCTCAAPMAGRRA